ncbi:histidinol dehydrogenase [Rubellicoccus peritrichatus]|uniref:Histidinol dehydrogenase n=1 Tax=Rubellicoccus peritrichatus TaxID=3080537 RepID=A0AAQ3LCF3_9BACT|nr:histidinol dehydrogenase [Puniceicoccus sp. CR14]WOO43514.1 histidinol dehydrogenase [Puniceicoccus sp. CR14]
MKLLETSAKGFQKKLEKLCGQIRSGGGIEKAVADVIDQVESRGDAAVCEYTEKFDGAKLTPAKLRLSDAEIAVASKALPAAQRKALRDSLKCVIDFHKKTKPKSWRAKNPHGATVGEEFYPIQRVGLYVPGGQVPLVSTVVMTVALAKLAGCPEIVVCTPPQADGSVNSALLSALSICGATEVYRVGGIQAIAAMAHGTKKIPAVDKIYGPGNAYVTEAKRQLFGVAGIDLLPGPSEVLVLADKTANPAYIAADLLAQAEHGSGKEKVYFVTTHRKLIDKVKSELAKQAETLSHAKEALDVIATKAIAVVAGSLDEAVEVANYIAPEHLELHVADVEQRSLVKKITTAGAILLGSETPTVLGDFTAGPSHTLPTDRTGRFFGGLQLIDFMRRTSIVKYDSKSASKAWPTVRAFSEMESLDAHGRSLQMRVES